MIHNENKNGPTYADAGVSIDAGNALVERIKPIVARTKRPGILGSLGGFGGMFELPVGEYRQPVMVSGTDGVGTKLRLAIDLNQLDTIGIDLVAMCVNDILVCGAQPLWFLDYFATGKLNVDHASRVIAGIAEGCIQSEAALLGGETAEMPGMYAGEDFDLAGFAVGVVEKSKIIDGSQVKAGDVLIGITSSGFHSNGYSLVRKIAQSHDLGSQLGETTLGEALLAPTRIYVKAIHALLQTTPVKAMAHITGGGLLENVPRSLPDGVAAHINTQAWQQPDVIQWIRAHSNIHEEEMLRTFNCGIGMTLVVDQQLAQQAIDALTAAGETAMVIGNIIASEGPASVKFN